MAENTVVCSEELTSGQFCNLPLGHPLPHGFYYGRSRPMTDNAGGEWREERYCENHPDRVATAFMRTNLAAPASPPAMATGEDTAVWGPERALCFECSSFGSWRDWQVLHERDQESIRALSADLNRALEASSIAESGRLAAEAEVQVLDLAY